MLRMATAATLSTTVGTICLANQKIEEQVRVTATGWGGTDAAESQATYLKEVQLVLSIHMNFFNLSGLPFGSTSNRQLILAGHLDNRV